MLRFLDHGTYQPLWLLLGALVLLATTGCGQDATTSPVSPVAETTLDGVAARTAASTRPSVDAMPLPTVASPTSEEQSSIRTLTWWTVPHFAPAEDNEAGRLLAERVAAFEQAHTNLQVEVVLKASHGKGGLLDFLLGAQKVAPTLLPDLATLNSDDLSVAMRAGLLQPLDDLLSDELRSDLYPFALDAGWFDGKLYAIQFEADIDHLVIDSNAVQSPPRTWSDVLTATHTYAFPTGTEDNPGDAFLIQYDAAGGQLGGRDAPFVLDEQALYKVLEFYEQGRDNGVIPVSVLGLENAEAVWPVFTAGRSDMAHVLASRFLAERLLQGNIAFGPLPTMDGKPATVSHGWTVAIIAPGGERQALAVQFLEALLSPEFNASWSQAANRLPTRRRALELWKQDDPYVSFLRWQLEAAIFHAANASYLEVAPILAQAQRDVLSGSLNAREATERATGVSLP